MSAAPENSHFATTQWSIVVRAASPHPPAAREALATLCQRYWFPLYAFARRRSGDATEAQDLTQSFFARLLERGMFEAASAERGKFRSFLLTAMKNFISNEEQKQFAHKRGGHACPLSLDFADGESRFRLEPAHELTAERLFDRQWSLQLLDCVRMALRQEYSDQGKNELIADLEPFLAGVPGDSDYARVAANLRMSEAACRQAVSRMRKRFRELLRAEVAATVDDPAEVDDEIHSLLASLSSQ